MKWLGRIALVILALLLILLVVQLIRWGVARSSDPDATFLKPRILLTALHVEKHDPRDTRMTMMLRLDDPAPIGLSLDSLSYVIGVQGVELIRSGHPTAVAIPAYGTATVTFPLVVNTKRLLHTLDSLEALGLDSVDYTMDLRLHVPALFWQKEPMERHFRTHAPLFKLPKARLQHPRIEKFGLRESHILVDMALYNPNVVPFAFKEMKMELRVGDGQLFATRIDSVVLVPQQDTVIMHLPIELSPGQLVEAAFDALVKPARTPFSYHLSLVVVSDDPMLSNSPFIMTGEGDLADMKQ